MPGLGFALVMFTVGALVIGFGLPASMTLAGALADYLGGGDVAPLPIDGLIARKARWQIWRMMALLCGLGVPGALLLITFNLDPGPFVFWIRTGAFTLFAVNALGAWRARSLGKSAMP
jgi:hypothetical protein